MPRIFLPLLICTLTFFSACNGGDKGGVFPDVGQGFESCALHAPWYGRDNDTRFSCHSTADRFWFRFEAVDSTLTITEPFVSERDVDPEDRVEIFFAADSLLAAPYYCAEIDSRGRIMDYKASYYREFDFAWNFSTMETEAAVTPWGYRVSGSVSREELRSLGMDLEGGFYMGVFQGETDGNGEMLWYSLVPADDPAPDFHQPKVLFPVRLTPKKELRGVVVYPDDITSLGLEEWARRMDLGGLDVIGLHAATSNDPIDTLEAFIRSESGRDFLRLCEDRGVAVEYELHALETLLPRSLFDSRPELFRENENGLRVADYNCCFTSPELVEAVRPQLEKMLEWMKPSTHRYYLWPDDKEYRYCYCEHCRELSPSEQTLYFENRLLELLRSYDPDATLAHLAYHQTLPAPRKVRAAEGIFLEFAPILRDYCVGLPPSELRALKDNLLAFPPHSQHILEYWLDESMQSRWKKSSLVALEFDESQVRRDVGLYRSLGAADFTCFATWLNGDYVSRFGAADSLFTLYRAAF